MCPSAWCHHIPESSPFHSVLLVFTCSVKSSVETVHRRRHDNVTRQTGAQIRRRTQRQREWSRAQQRMMYHQCCCHRRYCILTSIRVTSSGLANKLIGISDVASRKCGMTWTLRTITMTSPNGRSHARPQDSAECSESCQHQIEMFYIRLTTVLHVFFCIFTYYRFLLLAHIFTTGSLIVLGIW